MKDDPELETDEVLPEDRTTSSMRRRTESKSNKLLPVSLGILLVAVFAGGIFYFITRNLTGGDALLQAKMAASEQKVASLEQQIADLQGKLGPMGPDLTLRQQLEALAQRIEVLEKRAQPATISKAKPAPSKAAVTTPKRYHTVQKGENLSKISKKYAIPVEELRKLNNLAGDQSVQSGQRLLISPGQ